MRSAVKVALAGISGYGDQYLECLLARCREWGAELVGLVDNHPERCRRSAEIEARGLRIHSTVPSLLADDRPDLLMIATPIHQHAPQTCAALQQGVNVLCEKPLAGTLPDALKMLEAHRAAGPDVFAAIGYQWSFSAAIQGLKRDIMAGLLGRPKRLKALAFYPRSVGYFMRNDWAGRIHTDTGDGVLDSPVNNATAHFLHNMFYMLGVTRETSAAPASVRAELYRANAIENYDTAALRCETECGAELLFYTTLTGRERVGPRLKYEFELATVDYDAHSSPTLTARFHDGRVKQYGNPNHDRMEKIQQSIDAVRTRQPLPCGIPASLPHTLCVIAAQESAGGVVDLPERLRRVHRLDDGDMIVSVEGLPESLAAAYESATLPSELTPPAWSKPGAAVHLSHPAWKSRKQQLAAVGA